MDRAAAKIRILARCILRQQITSQRCLLGVNLEAGFSLLHQLLQLQSIVDDRVNILRSCFFHDRIMLMIFAISDCIYGLPDAGFCSGRIRQSVNSMVGERVPRRIVTTFWPCISPETSSTLKRTASFLNFLTLFHSSLLAAVSTWK